MVEIICPHCKGKESEKLKQESMGSGIPMQTRKCLNKECNQEFRGFYS